MKFTTLSFLVPAGTTTRTFLCAGLVFSALVPSGVSKMHLSGKHLAEHFKTMRHNIRD